MKRQNVRTLSLIVCTLTYLLVGAAVFDALESEHELKLRSQVERTRARLIGKYNITDGDYEILESIIVKAIPHKAGHQWKFSGAFYFAVTLYALAGIPLGLVMFQSIGERMNTFAAKVLKAIKRCFGREPKVTHIDLIIICTALSLIIIFSGAAVFRRYENWSYYDSIYYCFSTLVTVGFGDFVALQKHGALQNQPEYVIFVLIFIVSGLTVISAAMNLLVLRFLTLNTEDEKRDQRELKLAKKGFVSINNLRGRRQYSRSSSSASDTSLTDESTSRRRLHQTEAHLLQRLKNDNADTVSVCSCSCYQVPYNNSQGSARQRRSRRRRSTSSQRRSNALNHDPISQSAAGSSEIVDTSFPGPSNERIPLTFRRSNLQNPTQSLDTDADLLLRGYPPVAHV
ncbi:hypothetical protein M3Y98_00595400 [Aphelenchoides besseyi]|nr:hypothetical protein M3Y98_00595400 [Aphelenchoides besseyi]KAI6194017.1 hypothetical protein M3Y96_01080400 [Aphelenchoides besseyi]